MIVKKDFEMKANDWTGCLGGDPKGPIWFCGIEYGGEARNVLEENPLEYSDDKIVPCWNDAFVNAEEHKGFESWSFQQKVAKILLSYEEEPIDRFHDYMREKLYRTGQISFHMNLYPFNFPKSDGKVWSSEHSELTGLPDKSAYEEWCQQNRFPALRRKIVEAGGAPKVICCFGLGWKKEFSRLFLKEQDQSSEGIRGLLKHSDRPYFVLDGAVNGAKLFICPHLSGRWGIRFDEDLAYLGSEFKKLVSGF